MSELLNIPAPCPHVPQVAIRDFDTVFSFLPEKLRNSEHFTNTIQTMRRQRNRFLNYYVVLEVKESRCIIRFLRRDLLGAAERMRDNCLLVHFQKNLITYKQLHNGNDVGK